MHIRWRVPKTGCFHRLDPTDHHLLHCSRATSFGVPGNRRHDALVRTIAKLQSAAHLVPSVEPSIAGTSYNSRPNIVAISMSGGLDLFDVTIVADRIPTRVEYAQNAKMRQHEQIKERAGYNAIKPLVFSVMGGMHSETARYFKRLAREIAAPNGQSDVRGPRFTSLVDSTYPIHWEVPLLMPTLGRRAEAERVPA